MSTQLELEAPPTLPPSPAPPPPSTASKKHPLHIDPFTIIASSSSAISARLCTHPLDTLRIRIQTYPGAVVPSFKHLIPKPRMQTLYAGLPVALAFSVPALSVYLTAYEASKRYFASRFLPQDIKPTILQQIPVFVASGMVAEFASGAIWTPMDVLKARLQKGGEGTTSAITLIKKIWKEEGYRGVWRGYWLSNIIFVPSVTIYWACYESFKTRYIPGYDAYGPPPSSTTSSSSDIIPLTAKYTLCSVTACSIAACVTNPIELVCARWQTSAGKLEGGVKGIVKDLWRQGGVKAFGRGLGIRVAYAIPANGISMTTYESLKRWKGI